MNDRRHGDGANAGFTLIELLVTLTVLVVVIGGLTSLLLSADRTHRKTSRRAEIQAASRQAIALLCTELRQAGADPSVPPVGIVGIVAADSHTVHIRADINADGAIQTAEPSEDVIFTYDAANRVLLRNPGSGAVAALGNVTNFKFTYFDGANAPLAALPLSASDCSLVHTIGLTATCEDRDSRPFSMTTRITLRNQ